MHIPNFFIMVLSVALISCTDNGTENTPPSSNNKNEVFSDTLNKEIPKIPAPTKKAIETTSNKNIHDIANIKVRSRK